MNQNKKGSYGMFLWTVVILALIFGFFFVAIKLKGVADETKPGTKVSDQGRRHIAKGEPHDPYNSNPPTSGPHYGATANWGIYDEPVEDELLVHNLEHGGVLFLYKDLDDETLKKLKNLFDKLERVNGRVLLAPYPNLTDAKIALTAWTRLDKLQSYDESKITDFFNAFVDKGPEKVPLAATGL